MLIDSRAVDVARGALVRMRPAVASRGAPDEQKAEFLKSRVELGARARVVAAREAERLVEEAEQQEQSKEENDA
jgi:hypothetical protein